MKTPTAIFHDRMDEARLTLHQRRHASAYLLGWVASSVPPDVWEQGVESAIKSAQESS